MSKPRRGISADISFGFKSADVEGESPHMKEISSFGKHVFRPTSHEESITKVGEVKASAGYLEVNLGVTGKKEKIISAVGL